MAKSWTSRGIFDGVDMSVVTPLKDAVAKKDMAAFVPAYRYDAGGVLFVSQGFRQAVPWPDDSDHAATDDHQLRPECQVAAVRMRRHSLSPCRQSGQLSQRWPIKPHRRRQRGDGASMPQKDRECQHMRARQARFDIGEAQGGQRGKEGREARRQRSTAPQHPDKRSRDDETAHCH